MNAVKKFPDWANWIAMDQDGRWWCYEVEPHQHDTGWYENEIGRVKPLQYGRAIENWQLSLQQLKR